MRPFRLSVPWTGRFSGAELCETHRQKKEYLVGASGASASGLPTPELNTKKPATEGGLHESKFVLVLYQTQLHLTFF